jgi:GT2 family glycosyltransferase/2-polyprenyl-3-methyl-5-hydroxy-6-metoxy-1,4-benzoquinol methylase
VTDIASTLRRRQPDGARPDISVVVPTFDRAGILWQCLANLAQQTLPRERFEVIVVDDGSSDHTPAVLAAAAPMLRLTALRQPNLGPAAARNRGIEQARGRFVLFLNDDALLAPDALAIHLDEHTRRGPRDAVVGRFPMDPAYTPTDRPVGWCMDHTSLIFDYPAMEPGVPYGSGRFYTCNISLARDVVVELGGFDEGFVRMGAEDIEFGVRLEQTDGHVFYRPDCVAHHAHRLDSRGLARMFEFRGRGGVHLFVAQPSLDAPHYAAVPRERIDAFLALHARMQPRLERLHEALARFDALAFTTTGEAVDVQAVPAANFDGMSLWRWSDDEMRRMVDALTRHVEHHAERPSREASASLERAAACVYPALLFLKWYHDTVGVMSSPELPALLERHAMLARASASVATSNDVPASRDAVPAGPVITEPALRARVRPDAADPHPAAPTLSASRPSWPLAAASRGAHPPATPSPRTTAMQPTAPSAATTPSHRALRIDLVRLLDAGSLVGRMAYLNASIGRRLSSSEAAAAWLESIKAVATLGDTAALGTLIGEFLRLAPYHAKADDLYALWRGQGAEPLPDGSVVFLIPSCARNLDKARELRARLAAHGAVARVAVGDAALAAPRWHDDGVVTVPVADTYEALPAKVLAAIDAIVRRHGRVAIFKLDDDCVLDAAFSPAAVATLAARVDYAGVPVGDATHDRCWHIGKTADATLGPYARRFHGAWARGGAYLLGARAVDTIHREWALFPGEFDGEHFEDKMVGDFLRRAGIALEPLRTEDLGIAVDMRDRLPGDEPSTASAPPVPKPRSMQPRSMQPRSMQPRPTPPAGMAAPAPDPSWRHSEDLLASLPGPIAVVGNGVPARDFGAVIDRYPSVIRLNNYRVEGFEHQVGHKTSVRCTSGWHDIEPRAGVVEFSPFTEHAAESANVAAYRARSGSALPTAVHDIHHALPDYPRPSTGLALVTLLSALGHTVDLFGFDGFASGHYWHPGRALETTHARTELQAMLAMPGVTLYGQSYPYAQLYDFCHSTHDGYNYNEGLAIYQRMGFGLRGERIVEFGAGNGQLAAHLEKQGNTVTAVEVSDVAFARIPVASKIQGDCLTLPLLGADAFDRFVSMDVLEHLTENDVRIVVREAARLARSLLVTVSTRPSGLLGPKGENLHLTVRPVEWWIAQFEPFFDITATRGHDVGQAILEGRRRNAARPAGAKKAGAPVADDYALPAGYRARPVAEYYVDSAEGDRGVTWQPDVYPLAAELARSLTCRVIVDIGCGHARKLVAMHPEFEVVGVDFGPNIEHCRRMHRFGTWLESNLESGVVLPIPERVLARAVVVCSDVVEHTSDPRPLLHTLRDLLNHAPVAVISTPDRVRTHGPDHLGPPPNPAHTREWSLDEFKALLEREGFSIASLTHTRSNDRDNRPATILAVVVNPRHPGLAGTRFGATRTTASGAPAATTTFASNQAAARARVMAHSG